MNQLTYADRELLLETFDALRQDANTGDDELVAGACDWTRRLEPRFGFEHDLSRNVLALSRYLDQHKERPDLADIARGALRYLLLGTARQPSSMARFDLLDDAFIAGYAVQEIRGRLGEPARYNPPRLTIEEQRRAESLFLEFAASPAMDDNELISHATAAKNELADLASCGLFRRLLKNIDFLIAAIADDGRSREQRSYARAALAYLACENDAIDDRCGMVGYLDDNFIAQMAVELIEPAREPWLDLLDATVGALPFLNALVIDDGGGGRPFSEYMIVNAALGCPVLRAEPCNSSTVVVVPLVGPTPFLLGLAATLGLIEEALRQSTDATSFRTGQRVLVDFDAVRVFSGFEVTGDGRRLLRLTKQTYRTGESKPYLQTRTLPESDLWRLVPAPAQAKTRGEFAGKISRAEAKLTALECLFNAARTIHTHNIAKRVLLVMPMLAAQELSRRLRAHGYSIKDVVPIGSLTTDGDVKLWSRRFGHQEPLLIVASDLDAACVFAERNTDSIDLVIIDARGRNANKTASMRRLETLAIRTLIFAPEKTASSLVEDRSVGLWQWHADDLNSLLWPEMPADRCNGIVGRYERRLQSQSSADAQVKAISSVIAEDAFAAVLHLKSLAKARGDDRLNELEDAVSLAFRAVSWLIRCVVPVTDAVASAIDVEASLARLREIAQCSIFLSDDEREAIESAGVLLGRFLDDLKRDNPKAAELQRLMAQRPQATIIAPDSRILRDLEWRMADSGVRILHDYDDERDDELDGAIVPAWFGKDRMAGLLTPPVAEPLWLLLYEVERRWYESFQHGKRDARRRASRVRRSTLFNTVPGWRNVPDEPSQQDLSPTQAWSEPESVQDHIHAAFRSRVYSSAAGGDEEDKVDATFVVFEGQSYAFLTPTYRANVVTHLLDEAVSEIEEDDVGVKRKTVDELKRGDALLFLRRSDRDLIRVAADALLPDGVRETAALWRTALLNYAEHHQLSAAGVWRRLRECGCRLRESTIKGWLDDDEMIGPREYRHEVPIVAQATGDAELSDRLNDVTLAIGHVFSAHQQASRNIARKVLRGALETLASDVSPSRLVEIDSDIVLVRVAEIDAACRKVRSSMVNRLEETEPWHG